MGFSVRTAELDDLEILVSFTAAEAEEAESVSKPMPVLRRGVRAGLEDPGLARYWVLQHSDENIIGSVSVVKEWSDWNAGFYWWIQSFFVKPGFRGRGLSKMLLESIRKAAKEEKAIDLRLYVHKNNRRAINAYRREGFVDSPYLMMTLTL